MTVTINLAPALGDEQRLLLGASCDFMDSAWSMDAVRAYADGAPSPGDSYRTGASDLGWLGLLADEAAGGGSASGNGVLDAALIAAERGARLQPGPYVGHSVVVDSLTKAQEPESLLASLVNGDGWATIALDTADSCVLDGTRLTGTVPLVADADLCSWLLVAATSPDGPTLCLINAQSADVEVRRLTGLDVTRHWCSVEITYALVDARVDLADRQTGLAALLSAAETVGAMHSDLELAVQYSKDRTAFGRPIGSFQAIKHLLADTSLTLEMAKAMVYEGATALGTAAEDACVLAHATKAFVADRGIELAQSCFQVFGGIGFTWEHDQHFYLRRITSDAEYFGTALWHRERVIAQVASAR